MFVDFLEYLLLEKCLLRSLHFYIRFFCCCCCCIVGVTDIFIKKCPNMQKLSKVALFCISFLSLFNILLNRFSYFSAFSLLPYISFWLKVLKKSSFTQISSWKRNILITFPDNSRYSSLDGFLTSRSFRKMWVVVCSLETTSELPLLLNENPLVCSQKDFRHTLVCHMQYFLKCPQG